MCPQKDDKPLGNWTLEEIQEFCNEYIGEFDDEADVREIMDKCTECRFHQICGDIAPEWIF